MSGVLEFVLVLAATLAVIWLPGAAVIKASAWLRPRRDATTPTSYPAAGPAMDL
jgi:hypothetical protein